MQSFNDTCQIKTSYFSIKAVYCQCIDLLLCNTFIYFLTFIEVWMELVVYKVNEAGVTVHISMLLIALYEPITVV